MLNIYDVEAFDFEKQQHFFKSLIVFCFNSDSLEASAGTMKKLVLVASALLQNSKNKQLTNKNTNKCYSNNN